MSLTCAISAVTPDEPVISKQGYIFEKRLIVKHLKSTGTCPITKAELTLDDLIPVRAAPSIRPRPPTATSIPGLLALFQNEWDSVMLETHALKGHLESCRQELAHSLYKHDAACRVIARLIKERDAARAQLTHTSANVSAAVRHAGVAPSAAAPPPPTAERPAEEGAKLAPEILAKLEQTSERLSVSRKKRTKDSGARAAGRAEVAKFKVASSHPLHSASTPGITSLDLSPTDSDIVVTGGVDTNAIVFNHTSGKIVDTLKGHSKPVTDVRFHPTESVVITASADSTVNVWSRASSGKYAVQATVRDHSASVTGISVHPSGDYFLSASADKSWLLYDVKAGVQRYHNVDEKAEGGYTRITYHPDGLIFGAGTSDSLVRIWDLKQLKNVAIFKGHAGSVTGLAFSENGYYLASGDETGVVKLWDLRKLQNFHTIEGAAAPATGGSAASGAGVVRALEFDQSGTYLAVAGATNTIYTTKGWEKVVALSEHKDEVYGVRFGTDAKWVATVSKDRTLKIARDPTPAAAAVASSSSSSSSSSTRT